MAAVACTDMLTTAGATREINGARVVSGPIWAATAVVAKNTLHQIRVETRIGEMFRISLSPARVAYAICSSAQEG